MSNTALATKGTLAINTKLNPRWAHTFATGGSFTNGMPFSLSMGCGSWGGNSIDDNVHWKHFMQTVKIIREIPAREPKVEDIFSEYWKASGQ